MDTMLTDEVSRQKTEFPAKKPGLMVLFLIYSSKKILIATEI